MGVASEASFQQTMEGTGCIYFIRQKTRMGFREGESGISGEREFTLIKVLSLDLVMSSNSSSFPVSSCH